MFSYKSNRFLRVSFQTLVFLIVLLAIPQFGNAQGPYQIRIGGAINVLHDSTHFVHSMSIYLDAAAGPITGFEFNLAFDTNQFKLISAAGDSALMNKVNGAGWDFFKAEAAPFGPCGPACENGKTRIVARADIGSVPGEGSPFSPTSFPAKLATLTFETPSDSVWVCLFKPLRFVWFDCHDNYLVGGDGATVHVENSVEDYSWWPPFSDSTSGYPTISGIQADSCAMGFSQSTVRDISFVNGGFDFLCDYSPPQFGDVNLNEVPYEVADAVLLSRYLAEGDRVFNVDRPKQMAMSDANQDGFPAKTEDFVHLMRVVSFLAPQNPGPVPTVLATFSKVGDLWSIDRPIAVGLIYARGHVVPDSFSPGGVVTHQFEGENTRIAIFPFDPFSFDNRTIASSIGHLLTIPAPVIYAEFATPLGERVQTFYDCCEGIRGDANGDGRENPNVVDLALIVDYLFTTGPHIICPDEADLNNSGGINITDVTQLVSYLFQQGPAPVACP